MIYSNQSSDLELIKGCQGENRLAQKYLHQRYYGRLMSVCMRYTAHTEEAKEVLNSSFLKIFERIKTYEPTGTFSGWMATITLHTAIDHLRRQTTYRKVMDFNEEKDLFIQNDAINDLATKDLFALIQALPNTARSVFSLFIIDGYSHKEIGELLNISDGTSKWYLAEARKQLQQLINKTKFLKDSYHG
jgi:RNA polymerase sigma factor (sigma-70 family)